MNLALKLHSPELNRMMRSFHFWIIIAITAMIAIIYYTWKDWFPWFWRYFLFEFKNDIIGIPFLIPFLYASLAFWWRGSLVVWLISATAMLPRLIYYSPDFESLLLNMAFSFVPLTVVIIITLELKWREKQKQMMTEREKERQLYMSQIFKAQEDERRRIAQELHDDTMQELLVIANNAQAMVFDMGKKYSKEMREQAELIRDKILQVSEDVRRLSLDLRPSILDEVGLVSALRWLADRTLQDGEINTKVVVRGMVRKLRTETEVTIFRIVQEALNNIRRHSQATEAIVTLKFEPDTLVITILDNGKGFLIAETLSSLTTEGKLGIAGMQERARFLNGTFDIQSEIGKGTLISVEINNQ